MPTHLHPTLPVPRRCRAPRTFVAWMFGAAIVYLALLAQYPTPAALTTDAQVADNADIPTASPAQTMPGTDQMQAAEANSLPEIDQTRPDPSVVQHAGWSRFENVGRIPALIWRGGTILDLQLPVIYKLTQG